MAWKNSRAAARRQQDGSDINDSGANMNLWQRLWQDSINSCDNTVAERTWLDGIVRSSNVSGKTAATVVARTWLTGPGGSGGREAAEMSRKKQRQRSKLGLTATAGRQQGNSKTSVTTTAADQIWICGRGCNKTAATAVTTRWRSELGRAVVSATAMASSIRQQQ